MKSTQTLLLLLLLAGWTDVCRAQPPAGSAAVHVPQWAQGAVWYQIFPERFRNGDPGNDPTASRTLGRDQGAAWQLSPWTANWYKLQPWERRHSNDFYAENVFNRMYGGDLIGVIEKLDYLADLGVTALYFTPLFESPSLHKYDASTWHHIEADFGRNRDADLELMRHEKKDTTAWAWSSADSVFLELIKQAHARGLRVVIDGAFNHVGREFWAFQDVIAHQAKSRYANWFSIERWDDPATPADEMKYDCWWDVWTLPEFREDENGLPAGVKAYVWAITRRWMDPNGDGNPDDGVDGWRLDATRDVSPAFWREWCAYARRLNPEVYLCAEIWEEAPHWISNDLFNAVMNYPFAYAIVKFFINQRRATLSPPQFQAELARLLKLYPAPVNLGLMNLVNTHDTDRLASMICNPDLDYDRQRSPRSNPNYDPTKPGPEAVKVQKMIVALQATHPGAPLIFYGDEAGMWGADDPDCRKPMLWPEFTYEPETYETIGRQAPPAVVQFNHDLHRHYRTLLRLRAQHPALRFGAWQPLLAEEKRALWGFARSMAGDTVLAYFNLGQQQQAIALPAAAFAWQDVLQNEITASGSLLLPAKTAAVLVPRK
ncbi:MAG: glycoside hydrolase family 13 protein [candidate division KSB1 bacterium]|nr:glycoside hydrolase family 13 protein [candidate division KSB1 bacterium]MDZ7274959.1 glycoside hydrolase family 13 protein [candidate division KSB1 bacterium]MDZ7286590.1 glycoside hydrolase family 13 protein [candidate division KSB1 bacterium]MDZ7299246.1 glycoside hydrolase family 13 protein [candidate division KSB1 bacterium]MDZ7308897.1 glycoside hydrolase family 13 protein [candidate division KSB1 bacterium]